MNFTDELRKLADLRREGYLTEEEFAQAKRRILSQGDAGENTPPEARDEAAPAEDTPGGEAVFYASRLTSGNIFFPSAVILQGDGIVFYKRSWFGSREEHIAYRSVASLRVTNGVFFSTVSIETSGGTQPIVVNGLWKADAQEIQDIFRDFQAQIRR